MIYPNISNLKTQFRTEDINDIVLMGRECFMVLIWYLPIDREALLIAAGKQ